MRKFTLLITLFTFIFFASSFSQEFADFEFTGTNQGTGTFTNGCIPNFTWDAVGTINGDIQILNDEEFVDGNEFEIRFGQANNAENLRTQIYPNGSGTNGTPILSKSRLTINFDKTTPAEAWGFCVVDIDVEHCLISATDESGNQVDNQIIDTWLVQLFDTDPVDDGQNIPKWDSTNATLLGADTDEDYVVYNNLVISGLPSSEAASAFFMPNIPLNSLIIDFENLQETHFTSFHFYIAADDDKTFVPDDNFEQALIDLGYDSGPLNDLVPTANINTVTTLNVGNKNISDLTGIGGFTLLESLQCEFNKITSLDLSKNTKIEVLKCWNNELNTLDISKNSNLLYLYCTGNQLTSIDVTKNTQLINLKLTNNNLSGIDLSKNLRLENLYCEENEISSLNLVNNMELTYLDCSGNQLNTLNVTNNTKLISLYYSKNNISGIDLSKNIALNVLNADENGISNIDITKNVNLTSLFLTNNQIQSLNLSQNKILGFLNCTNNKIASLDLSNNSNLVSLSCNENLLTSLDFSKTPKLMRVLCSDNQITSLDFSINPILLELICNRNKISTLNFGNNPDLTILECQNNNLTTLNLGSCQKISSVNCSSNQISSIQWAETKSGNKPSSGKENSTEDSLLEYLNCSHNQLDTVDLQGNNAIKFLDCSNNLLPELDVSQLTSLNALFCDSNQIVSLCLNKNDTLFALSCRANQLSNLELKNGNNLLLTGTEYPFLSIFFYLQPLLDASENPNLFCIEVDDANAASTYPNWLKDAIASYSENCTASALEDRLSETEINIFPNPADEKFKVRNSEFKVGDAIVEIYDLNGIKLLEKNIPAGNETTEIDVGSLQNGVYFCRVVMNERSFTKKIIIQKP